MKHKEILNNIIPKFRMDHTITAVMLVGSLGVDTEYSTSDLVLFLLGNKNHFHTELMDGILVEYHYITQETAQSRLDKAGSEVYQYLGGMIIYDLDGRLLKLMRNAMKKYKNYITSEKEKDDLRYWLNSTKIKIESAVNNSNELQADFITTISSWKAVEAVFAINNIPLPPTGRVMQELANLTLIPDNGWFQSLFGREVKQRTNTLIYIIDWVLKLL